MKKSLYILSLLFFPLIGFGQRQFSVSVSNVTGADLGTRLIEIKADQVFKTLEDKSFEISDERGAFVPFQLTYDSLIVFPANIAPGKSAEFIFTQSDSLPVRHNLTWGRLYPERRDDVAYENQLVGFRIYGPGTQNAGEKSFGYDLFFKYPTDSIILPDLYKPETAPGVWAKVDSLRNISNELADEFINSFSYHIDHGKGFDPFAVGATLGAGTAALLTNDSIQYPWCYESVQILDNGPLRFTVALDFATGEHRLISLDAYSYVNKCKVWFDSMNSDTDIVAGFPLRDNTSPYASAKDGLIAYASPVSGADSGRALLGIFCPGGFESSLVKDNHILGVKKLRPYETFEYFWGFSWDKKEIPTMEEWIKYLETLKSSYTVKTNN